jgi:prephenate dehydratase
MRSHPGRRTKFGVCIDNTGYPASLEAGKLYAVIADEDAARRGYLRVIDESGEDYAYSAERFFLLDVPAALVKALRPRSNTRAPRAHSGLQPTAGRARMSGRG